MNTKKIPLKDRLDKYVIQIPFTDCHIWTGSARGDGDRYRSVSYMGNGMAVHRAVWIENFGEIPEGMCVCHKCDVTLCCNPNHLFLGTHQDNMADRHRKGRDNKVPTMIGEAHTMSKLTSEQVIEIRNLRKTGLSFGRIAKLYNVTNMLIFKICKRELWKHIQ